MKYTLSLITISIFGLIVLITFNSTSIVTHYQFKPINKFDQIHLSILSTEPEKELDLSRNRTEDRHQWALKNYPFWFIKNHLGPSNPPKLILILTEKTFIS